MAEFTIILEHIVEVQVALSTQLVMQDRFGDVIEAEDVDHAWELARQKYYADQLDTNIQIADVVSGNVEVKMPEVKQPVPQEVIQIEPTEIISNGNGAATSPPAQIDQNSSP
jgi:hypothetical protein